MSSELEGLFSSQARVQVLKLFLLHPSQPFYQREIERETGQPIRAVQREVERLEGIGLLVRSSEGNRVFYRLNAGFPLLGELTALFGKGAGVAMGAREEPSTIQPPTSSLQPFPWLESPALAPLPAGLRNRQVAGEWDRAY